MFEEIEKSDLKIRQKRLANSLYIKLLQANHLGLTIEEIMETVEFLLHIIGAGQTIESISSNL